MGWPCSQGPACRCCPLAGVTGASCSPWALAPSLCSLGAVPAWPCWLFLYMLAKRPSTFRSPRRIDLSVAPPILLVQVWPVQLTWTLGLCTFAVSGSGSNNSSSEKPSLTICRNSFLSVYLMYFVFLLIIRKGLASLCAVSPPVDCRGRRHMLAAVSPSLKQVSVNILMNWNEMNEQIQLYGWSQRYVADSPTEVSSL